jgi:predicted RNA-binding protein with TRAM domain
MCYSEKKVLRMERRGRGGFGGERRGGGFGHGGGRGGFGGGFGGDRRDFDKPKPVKIGEEYDVTITDVGAKGDGITKVENFIVFVSGAKKGEKCRIRIKEVANKFAIADKVGAASEGSTEESTSEESASEEKEESEGEPEEKESDEQ